MANNALESMTMTLKTDQIAFLNRPEHSFSSDICAVYTRCHQSQGDLQSGDSYRLPNQFQESTMEC